MKTKNDAKKLMKKIMPSYYTRVSEQATFSMEPRNVERKRANEREREHFMGDTSVIVLTCKLSKVHVQSKLVHCATHYTQPHSEE